MISLAETKYHVSKTVDNGCTNESKIKYNSLLIQQNDTSGNLYLQRLYISDTLENEESCINKRFTFLHSHFYQANYIRNSSCPIGVKGIPLPNCHIHQDGKAVKAVADSLEIIKQNVFDASSMW